jgi:hypothetical protein
MANRVRESRAQLEVWEWKKKAWEEVKHLDLKSAIRKRLRDSAKTVTRLPFAFSRSTRPKRCPK